MVDFNFRKIAVIGAGISGLSITRILRDKGISVDLYEASSGVGGIAMPTELDAGPYHLTGGHCFNSKFEDVKAFVFSILPEIEWNLIERVSKIELNGMKYDYPIEFSMKEIFKHEPDLAINFIKDFYQAEATRADSKNAKNLAEWFVKSFGDSLAREYFIPYNEKIWGRHPVHMEHEWVSEKLPQPNIKAFTEGLISDARDNMPHSFFYYPKSGSQGSFIRALADGQSVFFNQKIKNIIKLDNGWKINDVEYDTIISTAPMDRIIEIVPSFKDQLQPLIAKLKYNKITTMCWESQPTEETWVYFPSKDTVFHRHIHIGNFCRPKKNLIITEAVGEVSYDEMEYQGKQFEHLLKPLGYHVSEHAYVVFDGDYQEARKAIIDKLEAEKVFSLGRFGEWEYYNMDVCIKSALQLSERIFNGA